MGEQWPNDRQYLIQLGTLGPRNRTEIGVDRALSLTGTTNPGAGVEVRTDFLRQRKIAGTMEIPQLRGLASKTTLYLVHPCSFLYPFSSKYSFMTKYRKNSFLQFYIEIWQIFLKLQCVYTGGSYLSSRVRSNKRASYSQPDVKKIPSVLLWDEYSPV